jgi:hypothetical protein
MKQPIQTIWKFPLPIDDQVTVVMPRHSVILCAQEQNGRLCVWARVSPDASWVGRRLEIVGTGNPCEQVRGKYVGSAQVRELEGPMLVWHVFDAGEVPLPGEDKG